jgi:hypothetical protein
MRILRALTLVLVAAFAACGDDDDDMTMVDAGTQVDAGPQQTSLVDFVTGLVQGQTNETSEPVPVDDQTYTDTEDPAAFDDLLGI